MRIATVTRTLALVLGAGCLAVGLPTSALADFPGGGPAKSDCYVVYKGLTATNGKNKVDCTDGDAACDSDDVVGTCSFKFQVCLNDSSVAGCTPSNVTALEVNNTSVFPPALGSEAVCGDDSVVAVPLKQGKKGFKKGKLKVKVKATSASKPKSDVDKLKFTCLPGTGTTSTTIPGGTSCPPNGEASLGNPNTVVTTMLPSGSDLDSGWTGLSFNFPVIQDVQVTACLSNCDKTTDSLCDIKGPTGEGSANSATLGPPLPLLTANVGVCVVNTFQTQGEAGFTGTVDLATGVTNLDIKLFSDVYLTNPTTVCPRCETGTCSGGPNKGKACTVHGKIRVDQTLASNKVFQLSRDCPPDDTQFLARLNISLNPTTGSVTTPGTGGSKPCRENENKGVTAQDDACGGAKCSTVANCTGKACVSQIPSPVDGTSTCVDQQGGLSQLCCNNSAQAPSNSQVACHPTFPAQGANPAGPGINRTGKAVANPTPTPWGDDQYPKTASGAVLVSTFCIPPTGTGTVDITSGLPGPGALIFNTDAVVSVTPPTP